MNTEQMEQAVERFLSLADHALSNPDDPHNGVALQSAQLGVLVAILRELVEIKELLND